MNYAIILAAGIGKRFNDALPKQFHNIKDKPVLVHALENFINNEEIGHVVITVADAYKDLVKELVIKFFGTEQEKIDIVEGGKTRQESLINACNYIVTHFKIDEKDIMITHDAARPFVNQRIINENIQCLENADGVTTGIPTNNSILEVHENIVTNVPVREHLYILQTPQTFRIKEYLEIYESLTKEEKEQIIEASKVYVLRGKSVTTVMGEPYNIKVTTKYDLAMAKGILENKE